MATPYVAWLASLVWAINPELTNIQVKNLILENWSITGNLSEKLLTWKVINVNETLRAAAQRKVSSVTWLQSSWTGTISWDALNWVSKYYFEVFSWDKRR
jgi:subtilisin family serine protease